MIEVSLHQGYRLMTAKEMVYNFDEMMTRVSPDLTRRFDNAS